MLKLKNLQSVVLLLITVACNTNKNNNLNSGNTSPINNSVNDTVGVEDIIVKKSPFTLETYCNGNLQASQKAIVPFEVHGNLVNVLVKNGQWVSKGQTLALIDDYKQKQVLSQSEVNYKLALIIGYTNHLPSLSLYSYENDKLKLLWTKMIFKPYYTFKNNWRWVIPDKNRGGFENLEVSDNYIYVTYYGIKSGDWEKQINRDFDEITLLVFDFKGNLVKSILLYKNVFTYTETKDDRILYGMIERPDRLIVKYKLH